MRIIFIQDSLGTGGAERSNLELWYYLKEKGIYLKIIVLKHRKEGVEQEVLNEGFDVDFLKKGNFISHVFQIAKIIQQFKPDIVHSVLFKSNLRTRMAKFLTSFKHVESLVNCPYNSFRLNDENVKKTNLLIYKKIDEITQKFGVDHFHANGLTVSSHYQECLHIPESKISIINRGRKKIKVADSSILNEMKQDQKLNGDKIIIVNVARHEFQKAQDNIIEAIARSELLREKCIFISVGREGELTSTLTEKVQKYGLENQTKFLGHRTDVQLLLQLSDIFVFPSRFEGLPGALIEAESAGLPIVCSDIGNNLEVVKENENAKIFPVDDVDALKNQLEIVAKDSSLRKEMGIKSKKIFEDKFLLDNINGQMLDFYQNISS